MGALGFGLALGAKARSESEPSLAHWAWLVSGGATWGKFDSRKFRPEINPEPDVRPENASFALKHRGLEYVARPKVVGGDKTRFYSEPRLVD